MRIPGWAVGRPVPSDLYRYAERGRSNRYAQREWPAGGDYRSNRAMPCWRRHWQAGDKVELRLPMPIHRVLADDPVAADRGRVAIERGPIVYCVEGVDNRRQRLGFAHPVG